ncbi:hypothetical protein B296_00048252 [Ensete ventricosum]|uniref:Uncharacterized protein n=1 Tax=Ensete ventricosum TaxID=4639 RepID=A0A426X9I8_ENSVE|nr:hypothetical protein B296_00048252 [Ensete ventricosum]
MDGAYRGDAYGCRQHPWPGRRGRLPAVSPQGVASRSTSIRGDRQRLALMGLPPLTRSQGVAARCAHARGWPPATHPRPTLLPAQGQRWQRRGG